MNRTRTHRQREKRAVHRMVGAAVFLLAFNAAFFAAGKNERNATGLDQGRAAQPEIIVAASGTAGEAVAALFTLAAPADEITVELKTDGGAPITSAKGFALSDPSGNSASSAQPQPAQGDTPAERPIERHTYAAVLGLSIFLDTGTYRVDYSIAFKNGSTAAGSSRLDVTAPEWVTETIYLDEKNTGVRTDWGEERRAQIKKLNDILFSHNEYAGRFSGRYRKPVESNRITSTFGDRRIFVYADGGSDVSAHYGLDYGVPTGTEVYAAGSGKVVMAENRISTGWSIVIEHMPGVFSLYYHLNEMNCVAGDEVEAGQLIGKSGATGLATGPHLHLEFRVNGEAVSPSFFLEKGIVFPRTARSNP